MTAALTRPPLPRPPIARAPARFRGIDGLLDDARSRLRRMTPLEAWRAVGAGAGLVDIRPSWQRRVEGEVPGSIIVERNHLEWRLDQHSPARLPQADGRTWIVLCSEGYTSSLAADALNSIGVTATDIEGGFHAWQAAQLPTRFGETAVEATVPLLDAANAFAARDRRRHSPAPVHGRN
ncbi:MAG: sulfurtransferase [Pseudonocardiales bacterium]|nr:sulfurtransferase [Pseudonocardiales bacterium]